MYLFTDWARSHGGRGIVRQCPQISVPSQILLCPEKLFETYYKNKNHAPYECILTPETLKLGYGPVTVVLLQCSATCTLVRGFAQWVWENNSSLSSMCETFNAETFRISLSSTLSPVLFPFEYVAAPASNNILVFGSLSGHPCRRLWSLPTVENNSTEWRGSKNAGKLQDVLCLIRQ